MKTFFMNTLVCILIAVIVLLLTWGLVETSSAADKPIDITDRCLNALSANANSRVGDKVCLEDYSDKILITQDVINVECKDLRKDVRIDQRQIMVERAEKRVALKGAIPFCESLKSKSKFLNAWATK